MKQLLNSKAGVTVLEGVIALGLLALVTAGAFGVLLSASRQTSGPDIREEMAYAVEKAGDLLKVYINAQQYQFANAYLPEGLSCGPCGQRGNTGGCTENVGDNPIIYHTDLSPLASGEHSIRCLLPPVCDRSNSEFTYNVVNTNSISDNKLASTSQEEAGGLFDGYQVTFKISCNGYEL